MMQHNRGLALSAVLVALTTACGGGDEESEPREPAGPGLTANVDPVSTGTWYRPGASTTWQWQLTGTVNASYDVELYDIDLFDNDAETIADLQSAGHRVFCYFSAGSSEDWRDDYDRFTASDQGRQLDEWEGENWLDVTSENVLEIMLDRLDLAVEKGCDGVEPDNVDGWTNDTGFTLTAEHQLGYNRRLANEAHDRGLSVLLKNDGDQAEDLVDYFDGSLNEECHEYEECDQLAPFTESGEPILNAEYRDTEAQASAAMVGLCAKAEAAGTRTLILPWDLDDSFRFACD